ncbi:hypothetical protein [Sediminibacterium ginsengisoli]|uniref:Cytochrome C biogenesis protein transmembrane region n=1 Tax=Sediminibacterium ginsengisoli TaxID=413434 RepID=A0A1T4P2W2_9BACT|nr:hypothetical protein [Sediminibacterium ginsengisoli]SJZ85616.1 hypothetical protein SAMN04488132_105108 [Sediminibacterium ginsengisoli]
MYSIVLGSLLISILHALIPSHWVPIIAIAKRDYWSTAKTTKVTFYAALAHCLSTVLIGLFVGMIGKSMAQRISTFSHYAAPVIFIILGCVFIYRHHRHSHFKLSDIPQKVYSKKRIVFILLLAMFFSPCIEIEAYFLMAGTQSVWLVLIIAVVYVVSTVIGMTLLVTQAYNKLLKLNRHKLEHNAGIITGVTLILSGILSFFIF